WCTPCKIETPWLIELRNKYAPQGFEVLGISTEGDDVKPSDKAAWDKDKQAVEKFVHQEGVPYPVLMGGDGIAQPYGGVDDLPTSFFVNRKGVVVAAQMGLTSASEIEGNIRKALAD
ncbi:MAG TPA: TlpA disulfide reductase family protein, partial [Candidatus Acidoferrales bacterium]|nr:TlpA disulfide reductase family protein [Candidatus Acidoferrales bacterium]